MIKQFCLGPARSAFQSRSARTSARRLTSSSAPLAISNSALLVRLMTIMAIFTIAPEKIWLEDQLSFAEFPISIIGLKEIDPAIKFIVFGDFFCPLVVTTQALFGPTLTKGLMFRYCAAKKRFCTNSTFCTFLHRLVASKVQTGRRYYRHMTLRIGIAGSRKADLSSVML